MSFYAMRAACFESRTTSRKELKNESIRYLEVGVTRLLVRFLSTETWAKRNGKARIDNSVYFGW